MRIVARTGDEMSFGSYIRQIRKAKYAVEGRKWSIRSVASRIGITPSYLSKMELEQLDPPAEATIVRLARDLGEDKDVLLAMAGKLSTDLRDIITRRPQLFASLLRDLRRMPDDAIIRLARKVEDGKW